MTARATPLTLRQCYVGQIAAALVMHSDVVVLQDDRYNGRNFAQVVALNACELADALIEEMAKKR